MQCPHDSKNSRGINRCGVPQGKCLGDHKTTAYTCSLKQQEVNDFRQEQPETKEDDG